MILAAGKGTRLKSKHPKVLHEVGGQPLVWHVLRAASELVSPQDVYVIIGHEAERVRETLKSSGARFVVQQPQLGTGHALLCAQNALTGYDHVLVLSGDAPLIKPRTLIRLRDFHLQRKAAMTLLSAKLDNPFGYGRVLRAGGSERVKCIVEEKSLTPAQKKIREINSGFYAFQLAPLFPNLGRLTADNPHGEYYLTDMARLLDQNRERVMALAAENAGEILGSNTRAELVDLDQKMRRENCSRLMAEGVTIFYPETCVIDSEVVVGADSTIEPGVQLLGRTRIGVDCRIRSGSIIQNSEIGDRVLIRPGSILDEATVESDAVIGPYSHLRPGSAIGEGAHVGNFVETKKVRLGKRAKANHLTYLGDAEIGEAVNIGAGTITCNYDGAHKHRTVIEDGAFVGSDATLVAPVRVGKGAYIGAASCITEDVPAEALAIGRARQITKPGWAGKKRQPK